MSNLEKVLEAIDIVSLVREHVNIKKAGNNYKGLCPFHSESTPSFVVSPEKKIFKCFGCGAAGNAINFYMAIKKLSFIDSLKDLGEKAGLNLIFSKKNSPIKSKDHELKLTILKDAAIFYSKNLFDKKGQSGLQYLVMSRGLSESFIKEKKLGYASSSSDLYSYLSGKGYGKEVMLNLGLINNHNGKITDAFGDRVIFPIGSPEGYVIGFGGRSISEKNVPKYLNSPESGVFAKSKSLYGLDYRGEAIKEKGYAILMEGYMDVLAAHSHGFDNSVASLGTSFTKDQANLLSKYTKNVMICFDKDEAGMRATESALCLLAKSNINARVVDMGDHKDPDELLSADGKEGLREMIKKSLDGFDFLYLNYSKGIDLKKSGGKRKLISSFKNFFSSISNDLDREIYISKLASEVNLGKQSLKSFLFSKSKKKFDGSHAKDEEMEVTPLEIETLLFALKYPEKVNDILAMVKEKGSSLFRDALSSILYLDSSQGVKEAWESMGLKKLVKNSEKILLTKDLVEDIEWGWKKMDSENSLSTIEEKISFKGLNKIEKSKLLMDYYKKKREM